MLSTVLAPSKCYMKLWRRQKKPVFGVSCPLMTQDILFSPWFKAPRSWDASICYPQARAEWLLWNFYQRASRGSSSVKLLWSTFPSFLYKINLCPEARDFFSTRNLLLRENWSPHQKTWTQSCFQRTQGFLYFRDRLSPMPRFSSWATVASWNRKFLLGLDPEDVGLRLLKLTLLWPVEFWVCASFNNHPLPTKI